MMITRLLIISGMWVLPAAAQQTWPADDPITALDDEYTAAQRSQAIGSRSRNERRIFYEEWLEKFQEVVRENPDSPWVYSHRDARLELFNTLGRYGESVKFVEAQLALLPDEHHRHADLYRAGLLVQIGGLASSAWAEERDESYARKSVDSFRKARKLRAKHNDLVGLIDASKGEAQTEWLAFGNNARAAELYMQAYELLPRVPENLKQYLTSDANPEHLLSNAAWRYARAGQGQRALEVFQQLARVPEKDLSRTVYLSTVLSETKASGCAGCEVICPYVETWLDEHADDEQAPSLALSLAYGFRRIHQPERAIVWFERYLEYVGQRNLVKGHEAAIRSAHYWLAGLYDQTGDEGRAEKMRERLRELEEKPGTSDKP